MILPVGAASFKEAMIVGADAWSFLQKTEERTPKREKKREKQKRKMRRAGGHVYIPCRPPGGLPQPEGGDQEEVRPGQGGEEERGGMGDVLRALWTNFIPPLQRMRATWAMKERVQHLRVTTTFEGRAATWRSRGGFAPNVQDNNEAPGCRGSSAPRAVPCADHSLAQALDVLMEAIKKSGHEGRVAGARPRLGLENRRV